MRSDSAEWRDEQGRTLADFPRPSVAVDTAVLTLEPGGEGLSVLQVRRDGPGWALPGTFLHAGERLLDAVLRSLRDKAGVAGMVPDQLHVFDEPDRDDRGWVLSVAHVMLVPTVILGKRLPTTRLAAVASPGRLPYGHRGIVDMAVSSVRRRYVEAPDPGGLLREPFTMSDLRRVHAAVAAHPLQKDTFRRAMEPQLLGTGELAAGARCRPAELYRRRPA